MHDIQQMQLSKRGKSSEDIFSMQSRAPSNKMSMPGQTSDDPRVSKHSEDAVVPAQRRGVRMSFEQQMELYDQSVKSGIDPELNSNLLDLQGEEDSSRMSTELQYSGPLRNLFD